MWTKLSNALKPRNEQDHSVAPPTPTASTSGQSQSKASGPVMSRVLDEHPNLSVFHPGDVPFPVPSPPSSPSKTAKASLFKRASRTVKTDDSLKLTLSLPKKVRSTLNMSTYGTNVPPQPSGDAVRSSSDAPRPSIDTQTTLNTPPAPYTPVEPRRPTGSGGSVRSILRDRNTPATGASVRFFSRDAYRVITPDNSANGDAPETFLQRLQQASPEAEETRFYSAQPSPANDMFSPPRSAMSSSALDLSPPGLPMIQTSASLSDLLNPIPPPEFTNLFDLSQEYEVTNIPISEAALLQDNAVEVSEFDESQEVADIPPRSFPEEVAEQSPVASSFRSATSNSSRSKSLGRRTGDTVFHSISDSPDNGTRSSSSLGLYKLFGNNSNSDARASSSSTSSNRSRSHSESVFSRPPASQPPLPPTNPASRQPKEMPEADINDMSASDVVVYGCPSPIRSPVQEIPDPFRANATTYYTPETQIPNTPPRSRRHGKSDSKGSAGSQDESALHSLRTQLALQQELAAQYEVDLRARDELVEALTARLEGAERDAEKRKSVMRGWKKKVAELERACRGLEEEVTESRQASFERSVMDEASGEALRQLHRQISFLEREKTDVERREASLREEKITLNKVLQTRDDENTLLREELSRRVDAEKTLEEGILQVREQMEMMGTQTPADSEELRALVVKSEQAVTLEHERHRAAELAWEEDHARLTSLVNDLLAERDALRSEVSSLEGAQEKLLASEDEVRVLRNEVEAQWRGTEATSEKMAELERERDSLKTDIEALEARAHEMELEWNDSENKRAQIEAEVNDAWNAKDDVERERDQIIEELAVEREEIERLRRSLESIQAEVIVLQQERQFALDDLQRLQGLLGQRDKELSEAIQKTNLLVNEAEDLRSELSQLRREHARFVDTKGRDIDEMARREEDMRKLMEGAVCKKAEVDVELTTLRERTETLREEVEKLRRQVHVLKGESADREVKFVQLEKLREQDKEDRMGLNIALDSKQQELELLKRKLGVRGTGGSTPAAPTRTSNRRESFMTPIPMMRPSSALSDTAKDLRRSETPTTVGKTSAAPALGKSTRANAAPGLLSTAPSAMKATRFVEGSMGPPPARPRSSLANATTTTTTPGRTPSALGRSLSSRPSIPATPSAHRRSSSTTLEHSQSLSHLKSSLSRSVSSIAKEIDAANASEEKENAKPTPVKVTRRSSILASPA